MAIDKKLIHFKTKKTFAENKSAIPETSITFIKDANEIYTQSLEYQWVNWKKIEGTVPDSYQYFYTLEGALKDSDGLYFYTVK